MAEGDSYFDDSTPWLNAEVLIEMMNERIVIYYDSFRLINSSSEQTEENIRRIRASIRGDANLSDKDREGLRSFFQTARDSFRLAYTAGIEYELLDALYKKAGSIEDIVGEDPEQDNPLVLDFRENRAVLEERMAVCNYALLFLES